MPKTKKRGWLNPPRFIKRGHKNYCKLCHKKVKNIEEHNRSKHKK